MKEYKPIMVWYFVVENLQQYDMVFKLAKEKEEELGYSILLFGVNDEKYVRVEIISVDKATVVEDIQKYIDEKLEK